MSIASKVTILVSPYCEMRWKSSSQTSIPVMFNRIKKSTHSYKMGVFYVFQAPLFFTEFCFDRMKKSIEKEGFFFGSV